eukprot:CAMPEP_0174268080 /NCGR_PEP_ID=MMETSP0439-20130205/36050_1 /TAXON_ID=0 /ORGANISM="Stereomyxa ramosa, Strain Chinc5" /LENGTH=341 /DNA_ID=CAMNT_0015356027 /DNA_START=77 /DNA_END=1099 /DNA_ORIENTATION=+
MSESKLNKLNELIFELEQTEGKKAVLQNGKVKLIEAPSKLEVKMGKAALKYLNSPVFSDCVLLLQKKGYSGKHKVEDTDSGDDADHDDFQNNKDLEGLREDVMVVPAHSTYLGLRSKFFENLFLSPFQESESKVVNLSEIAFPEAFLEVLLPFMYTGILEFETGTHSEKFLETVAMADYFGLDEVFQKQCTDHFSQHYQSLKSSPLFVHHNLPFWLLSGSAHNLSGVPLAELFFLWARNWPQEQMDELGLLAAQVLGSLDLEWEDLVRFKASFPGTFGVLPSDLVWKSGCGELKKVNDKFAEMRHQLGKINCSHCRENVRRIDYFTGTCHSVKHYGSYENW